MKKMLKLVKGGKREDKSGANTPSGDELDDELESSKYCYKIDSDVEDKMSRLHKAAWHGSLDKVKTLVLKKAADISSTDSFGRTPLHLAMAKDDVRTIFFIYSSGTKFLVMAVECGQKECVQLILERGADVTCTDTNKNTALHLATKQGSFTMISMLLKKGISINAQNAAGESVLHVACSTEKRNLIEFIIDNGAFVNIIDKQGQTPLMLVAKLGNMSIIDLLLEKGSHLESYDINGLTAKDYASKAGHSKVVKQLSMQKMSIMARTRSKENVLDDSDQVEKLSVKEEQKINDNFCNEKSTSKENINETHNDGKSNSVTDNVIHIFTNHGGKKSVLNELMDIKEKYLTSNDVENNSMTINEIHNFVTPDSKKIISNEQNDFEGKVITNNIMPLKDEESVSQCTMPPPMDPSRSWDFIQASIKPTDEINDKVDVEIEENNSQIPKPLVCPSNPDDSELEWGSDESLPTDPNQSCSNIDLKSVSKKVNTLYSIVTEASLMSKNKDIVLNSAENIIENTLPNSIKHVRNKSNTSLETAKLTIPSDVDKALLQLSPEMNFAHSSFGKSKSFNEHVSIETPEILQELERSKSLCLELKIDDSDNLQKDSDSQSDDSLRSKRSLLLSMRMPKVHDDNHDEVHLDIKDNETSEDESLHYWYSPHKKCDKIVQQDTVIKKNSKSDNSGSEEEIDLVEPQQGGESTKSSNESENSDSENIISFSTSHEDIYGTHQRTRYALKRTESLKAYLKRVTIDKDKLQQETAGYKEITELLKYKLGNLEQEMSFQNENTTRLQSQIKELDIKYTDALNKIESLELSNKNLVVENQYLKQINSELIEQLDNGSKYQNEDLVDPELSSIKKLQAIIKMEQDKRTELEQKVKLLAVDVNIHQSCGPSLELLKQLQQKINIDYVPKKEILKLKTEQERKISKVKIESEKKLADKFQDLNKLLSKQMNQQEKLELQREKIEIQLKKEFENTRQKFQLEIAKLQTTLKTKEMEEQILREKCEILSQEIEKTQDCQMRNLIEKTYSVPINLSEIPTQSCSTLEPNSTFEKSDSPDKRVQCNVQKLRTELDNTIAQKINDVLNSDHIFLEK
ncbi:ankyrin repeat domain-containing protein 18A-like isoform X3 [Daktulosphaira vitifoliae]|uniref:ankyrin repeat domain-containing protein 18A-like isoform X3 n=1 Tax=Daktulosphaira vitifoliae TaxID=58002 RepID=UPI0021A992BA|nr:ankyrin repeat domain-containing protein 18A-like isoform X3 [Daktulosphaira vitifoliae]